jgi:hypothetical protein
MRRFIVTVCLVLMGVTAVAWPASRMGISFEHSGLVRSQWVLLRDGLIWYRPWGVSPGGRPLDRERYTVAFGQEAPLTVVGRPLVPGLLGLWRHPRSPDVVAFRVVWLGAAGSSVLLLALAIPWDRRRGRRRRGVCLVCAYERGADNSTCPECGTTPEQARERTRVWPRRAVRDAGIVLFLMVLAVSCGLWLTVSADEHAADVSRDQAFDYSWYLETCQPRLDGRVAYAEPGNGPRRLTAVLGSMGRGGTIVLLPGTHELPDAWNQEVRDVWLVGCGAGSTVLKTQDWLRARLSYARLRIDGVSIDCNRGNGPRFETSGVMLRDCRVFNAGPEWGPCSLSASASALLIESCVFEGRADPKGRPIGGLGVDLRDNSRAFLRGDRFVSFTEVVRHQLGVMDGCQLANGGDSSESRYWARGGRTMFDPIPFGPRTPTRHRGTRVFFECVDDLDPMTRLASGAGVEAWKDPLAREMAERLWIRDDRETWRRLLKASSPEVRKLAAGRLKLAPLGLAMPLEDALGQLDQPFVPADAALSILGAGELARPGLELAAERGAGVVQGNAAALLRLLDVQPSLPEMVGADAQRPR